MTLLSEAISLLVRSLCLSVVWQMRRATHHHLVATVLSRPSACRFLVTLPVRHFIINDSIHDVIDPFDRTCTRTPLTHSFLYIIYFFLVDILLTDLHDHRCWNFFCPIRNGEFILDRYSMPTTRSGMYEQLGVMLVFFFVLRCMTFGALAGIQHISR